MSENELDKIQMDTANLYREEQYTDLKVGSIHALIPITAEGTDDDARGTIFMAHTQIMSQMGPIPLQGEIEAANLAEAIEKFPEAVQAAMEKLAEEAKQRQIDEANRIVTPGDSGAGNLII